MSDQVLQRDTRAAIRRPRRAAKPLMAAAFGVAALLGGAAYGHHWWTTGRFIETTDDAYVGGNVTAIAPHVAGFVRQIIPGDNEHVAAGQPLVRLDADDFQAALRHAEAVVRSRQAALANLQARRTLQQALIAGAAADLDAKQAEAAFTTTDAERYRALASTAAGSRQSAEKSRAADRSARAGVLAATAAQQAATRQLDVIDTDIDAARADLDQASADLTTARLNLGYTTIAAPTGGYVGNRSAQVGTYVAAGTDLLSIVPESGLWVDANFKEDQIAHMQPGDPATITADVLPGRRFQGHVDSTAPATGAVFSVIPPQNATGNFTKIVQRVPVRIRLDGEGAELGLLRPGLSATVSVTTRPAS